MKKLALLVSTFLLTAGLTISSSAMPAKADANAAFCLESYGTSGALGCNYYTLAQCKSASSGGGGLCVANPMATRTNQRDRATR